MMQQRDLIAQLLANRQQGLGQQPQQRPLVPRPFMPPQVPVRSMSPTMIGTPPQVQQKAVADTFEQAMRNADPVERYEAKGGTFGRVIKNFLFGEDEATGSGAP
jgi:hypothetical protein